MIRYTEDAADLEKVGSLSSLVRVSVAANSTPASARSVQVTEDQAERITVRFEEEDRVRMALDDDEDDLGQSIGMIPFSSKNKSPVLVESPRACPSTLQTPVAVAQPLRPSVQTDTRSSLVKPMNLHGRGTRLGASNARSVGNRQRPPSVTRRLVKDNDFPDSAVSRPVTPSMTAKKKPEANNSRKSDSKQDSHEEGERDDPPISLQLIQMSKRTRNATLARQQRSLDECAEAESLSMMDELNKSAPNVFSTPPRGSMLRSSTGSSIRGRRMVISEVGGNASKLVGLLRTAKGRVRQEMSEILMTRPTLSDRLENTILVKVNRVESQEAESYLLSTVVLEKGGDDMSVAKQVLVGDSVFCVVPYILADESGRDRGNSIMHSLAHVGPDQNLSGVLLEISRPWKLVHGKYLCLLCSGLVRVVPPAWQSE